MRLDPDNSRTAYIVYIVTLGLLCAFGPLCTDIYLPGLPAVTADFATDPATAQLSMTSSFLGLALGQIIIGPVSDAYGRRGPLLISLIIFIITSYLCAISPTIEIFILWRFFQGIAGAGGVVLARSIAADKFKGSALTQFMSLLMSINSIAPIAGPVIGSFIITVSTWPTVFYFLTVLGVVLLLLSFADVPESHTPTEEQKQVLGAIKSMFRELGNKKFVLAVLALSFIMGGFFGYLAASPFIFQVIYSFTPMQYSLAFGSITVCIAITSMLAGRLSRRIKDQKIISFGYLGALTASCLIMFFALFQPETVWPVLLSLMLFCAMMGTIQTVGFGIVMRLKKGGAGAASGILGVMHFLFGALSSPFMGIMGDHSMIPLGVCMVSGCILGILCLRLALYGKDSDTQAGH